MTVDQKLLLAQVILQVENLMLSQPQLASFLTPLLNMLLAMVPV